ncbi:hypothetical protein RJ641_017204 [Dillenia turbinata]|uniref:Uncharacterized protein n=1 Tax=Dillenia turbinata TaxID=194707 RepID=A0AAN8YZI8_9MAGN
MSMEFGLGRHAHHHPTLQSFSSSSSSRNLRKISLIPSTSTRIITTSSLKKSLFIPLNLRNRNSSVFLTKHRSVAISSSLDLTEDNVKQVLSEARVEFPQIFDPSVGITGEAELAEVDGPFVKIRLRGKFWHKRSTVLARLGNYLQQRIPEILEVDIEDEKQLDDSPDNF